MKNNNVFLISIAVILRIGTFAQNPSEGYVRYDADGIPRQVMNLEVKQFTGTDTEIANQFLDANKTWICGSENGNYEFARVIENPAGKHFTYVQKISGIPVLGSGLVISVNTNHYVSHVYNGYRKNLNPPASPVITAQQAITLALNTFDNPEMQLKKPRRG
jgi:Zn-dependent metalloprotease